MGECVLWFLPDLPPVSPKPIHGAQWCQVTSYKSSSSFPSQNLISSPLSTRFSLNYLARVFQAPHTLNSIPRLQNCSPISVMTPNHQPSEISPFFILSHPLQDLVSSFNHNRGFWEFPGGPVVRAPRVHRRDPGSIPGQGTKIPQAAWRGEKKRRKRTGVLNLQSTCHKIQGSMNLDGTKRVTFIFKNI